MSSENFSVSKPFLLNLINSPGTTSLCNVAATAVTAADSEVTMYVSSDSLWPKTIGRNPLGSLAAYTELSSEIKVKQYEPTISFFKIESAFPISPFSEINETNLSAATKVSLAFCGVKEQPPTKFDNSWAFAMVPLCAIQRSFTLSG